jgi:hypothetical protein
MANISIGSILEYWIIIILGYLISLLTGWEDVEDACAVKLGYSSFIFFFEIFDVLFEFIELTLIIIILLKFHWRG